MRQYRWVLMAIVLMGTFMTILDTTIVNVALPQIGGGLRASQGVEWVVTAYLLAVGVVQPASGWLADRFGRKPVFLVSVVVFTIGSLLSGLSVSLPMLVVFRSVQGLGGGILSPVGLAMVYEVFPAHDRGRAMGIWGMSAMAAPAAGPVLGGWLLTIASWRWMFFLNVPVGITAVVLGVRLLRSDVGFVERRAFDWVGLSLASTAMVAILLATSEGAAWGWRSPQVIGLFVASAVLLSGFVAWVLHRRDPLLDVRMFAIGPFSLSITIIALRSVGQFGRLVFIPLELEGLRRMSPLEVGLILCPSALAAAAVMPVAGRLSDRIDPRLLVAGGLTLTCGATWGLAYLTIHTATWSLVGIMVLGGLGTGMSIVPCVVVGLNSLPSRLLTQGTAARQMLRQVVAAVGTAALAAVVIARVGGLTIAGGISPTAHVQSSFNDVFVIGFWMSVIGFLLALLLPGREQCARFQQERAREFGEGWVSSTVVE